MAGLLECDSLQAIARSLREGSLTAAGLMGRAQAAWQASEPLLNAYKYWAGDAALELATQTDRVLARGHDLGPLMGIPVSVKDMYAVPGMPTFAGSPTDLGASWQQPGPLVQGLLSQLAPITGKTHTVEFALGGVGINAHWGTPYNPWDRQQHRVPGGSSSGAGVSLCQGSALLALGTDTGGSVRIPAALTGMVGLKTSTGYWPTQQIVPLSPSLDSPGLLTRTVADAAFAFAALEGAMHGRTAEVCALPDCRGLRLGVVENFFWEDASPVVIDAVEQAIRKLEQAGARLVPIEMADCGALFAMFSQGGLSVPELASFLTLNMPQRLAQLDPVVRARVEAGGAISALEYLERQAQVQQARLQAASLFGQHRLDAWLHPTVAQVAAPVSELGCPEAYRRYNMLLLRNPAMANLMGLCALSLPAGLADDGLPAGLQVTAAAGRERALLAMGQAMENELGGLLYWLPPAY